MPTKERIYRFDPYGPFDLPLVDVRDISKPDLAAFWGQIEDQYPGLPGSLGCYVFAVGEDETSLTPWYVGKTEQKSLKFESVQSHKILHYQDALKLQPGGRAFLFFIPRMTDGGKFRKVWASGSSSVARLEGMLIELALKRNPKLVNKKMIKHLTQTVVTGYMPKSTGSQSQAAAFLSSTLDGSFAGTACTSLTSAITSIEKEAGKEFVRVNHIASIFQFQGRSYTVSIQPYVEK